MQRIFRLPREFSSSLGAFSDAQWPLDLKQLVLGLRFAHLEELEESKRFAPP
jgi:hypothetical protein